MSRCSRLVISFLVVGLVFPLSSALAAPVKQGAKKSASAKSKVRSVKFGTRALKKGMKGGDVKVLQDLLNKAGISTKKDGSYSPQTTASVRRFERLAALPVDGVVSKSDAKVLVSTVNKSGKDGGSSADGATPGPVKGDQAKGSKKSGPTGGASPKPIAKASTTAPKAATAQKTGKSTSLSNTPKLSRKGAPSPKPSRKIPVVAPAPGTDPASIGGAAATPPPPALTPGELAKIGPDGRAIAPASAPDLVKAVIQAANEIHHLPYRYGGGHAKQDDTAYDCSGSVSYALRKAGLLAGSMDSSGLMNWGGAGAGKWITVYTNAGHAYMVVAGLRFDTGFRGNGGKSRWATTSRVSSGFQVRHAPGL